MFTIALVLTLFLLVDVFLESLENYFSPEELIEMGIQLDGLPAVESR